MANEVFSSTSYNAAWTTVSDVWVLLNPDLNQWTEEIDWSLGMLLRRALLRLELKAADELESPSATKKHVSDDVLLLAAPEGMPASRILVLRKSRGEDGEWLRDLGPILTKMKAKTATVFAPREWRAPTLKAIAEISQGEWGLRWVEPAG